ncbi:MAG: diguanylate cyclase [Acidaminobacter sp.]|uniref:GGDEF domain-containing protein n=1 Tax=Acidaminobacter sp. TaxID=1872102 RepID=UPI001382FFE1|nr:GGDEF domain-containing protein [Acidaminobacter sp.]MZQ99525.1 diguanylate cyclase [Acidaminobacter sp.]
MNNQLHSFLIQCDRKLNIVTRYWNRPLHSISPYQKNLLNLFEEKFEHEIVAAVAESFNNKDIVFSQNTWTFKNPRIELSVCLLVLDNNLLVHGIESFCSDTDQKKEILNVILFDFMNVIKESNKLILSENEQTVRNQFEQIQKLNNELLNVQRDLRKANIQMNQLNKELNNRLVKDALTGLVSRYQYRQEIEHLIKVDPYQLGVFLFIDIDDFKVINDTHGHRTGDLYLISFAERLKTLKFESFIAMRISGDEFGVYIHGYRQISQNEIARIWNEFKSSVLNKPIEIENSVLDLGCSVGMAIYGMDTTEVYDLIEYADFAMYQAKNNGKNTFSVFDIDEYRLRKK